MYLLDVPISLIQVADEQMPFRIIQSIFGGFFYESGVKIESL